MTTLSLSDELYEDTDRIEVLRAWLDGGMLSASVANDLEYRYEGSLESTWAMLLSDIGHHVADAIALESKHPREFVANEIIRSLSHVSASGRETRKGKLYVQKKAQELQIDFDYEKAKEIVRVVFSNKVIHVVVHVGMWIESGEEEDVWANILYDLSAIISEAVFPGESYKKSRLCVLESLQEFLEKPTTDSYHGRYF